MDTWTYIRLMAHIILIGWATAAAILLILARGKSVRIVHVKMAIMALSLFILWIMGLVISMRSTGIVSRESLIPVLSGLELGTGICAWGWLSLIVSCSFRFSFRANHFNTRAF